MPNLPRELYEPICENLLPSALAKMCGVSKAFFEDAQRVLYRTVIVRDFQALRFCELIRWQPRLSPMVLSLKIHLTSSSESLNLTEIIPATLRMLTSLKELELIETERYNRSEDILAGCTFSLVSFRSSWSLDRGVIAFLRTQPNIKHFGCDPSRYHYSEPSQVLPAGVLPILSSVDGPINIIEIICSQRIRNLTHLCMHLHNVYGPRLLDLPRPISQKLISLDIHESYYQSFSYHLIPVLGELAPEAKFLRISQIGILAMEDARLIISHTQSTFSNLETFVIGDQHTQALQPMIVKWLHSVMQRWVSLRCFIYHGKDNISHFFIRLPSGEIDGGIGIYDCSMWRYVR